MINGEEYNAKTRSNFACMTKELALGSVTNKTQCLRCTETFKSGNKFIFFQFE